MDLGAPLSRSNSSERTNGSPERGHPLLYRRHRRLDVLEVFTPIFVPTMTGHPIFDTKEAFRESVSRPDHIPGVASPLPEDQYMRFLWGNLGLSILHVISHASDRRSAFPLSHRVHPIKPQVLEHQGYTRSRVIFVPVILRENRNQGTPRTGERGSYRPLVVYLQTAIFRPW